MRLSWSSIQKFLSCQRAYELHYIEGLQRKPGADKKNLLRGSAFHVGLDAALQASAAGATDEVMVKAAKFAAENYLTIKQIADKTVYNWTTRQEEPDVEYAQMFNELHWLVPNLLEYHIPMIGLGKRYQVVKRGDVVELGTLKPEEFEQLAIEWKFNVEITSEDTLSGIIDTVLYDTIDDVFLLVDWKTRDGFPNDSMALLDGQLHLYAGVLNTYFGAKIARVAMWQFLTSTPKPASMSVKGIPNTGAASYATTWKHWCETLPYGIDPEKYEEIMRPKMKQDADFQRLVIGEVTKASTHLMFENVQATLASLKASVASELPFPAVLGSSACKWCDFAKLCANAFRYGGDVTEILERDYEKKSGGSLEVENVL